MEQKRLRFLIQRKIKKGKLKPESPDDFLKTLSQMPRDKLIYMMNNIRNNSDNAMIYGFGYNDRDFKEIGEYEYALIPVYLDKSRKETADLFKCLVFSTQDRWARLIAAVYEKSVKLKWTIKGHWPQDVSGFSVMRRLIGDKAHPHKRGGCGPPCENVSICRNESRIP